MRVVRFLAGFAKFAVWLASVAARVALVIWVWPHLKQFDGALTVAATSLIAMVLITPELALLVASDRRGGRRGAFPAGRDDGPDPFAWMTPGTVEYEQFRALDTDHRRSGD